MLQKNCKSVHYNFLITLIIIKDRDKLHTNVYGNESINNSLNHNLFYSNIITTNIVTTQIKIQQKEHSSSVLDPYLKYFKRSACSLQ